MFGIGMPEMILILAVALIVIGPKKLPDLAKSLGKAMREFRTATQDIKASFEVDDDIADIKKNLAQLDMEGPVDGPKKQTLEAEATTSSDPYKESDVENEHGNEKSSGR